MHTVLMSVPIFSLFSPFYLATHTHTHIYVMDYIDFSQPTFYYVLANILFNPLFWNTVARAEYRSHILTKLAGGNRYLGCYVLAVTIFSIGIIRDYLYTWLLTTNLLILLSNLLWFNWLLLSCLLWVVLLF